MSLDSDSKVHINKSISLLGLVQLTVIVLGLGTIYGATTTEIKALKEAAKESKKQTIDKVTIEQMFKIKEIQINNLDDKLDKVDKNVDKLDVKLDKIQILLIEIAKKQTS